MGVNLETQSADPDFMFFILSPLLSLLLLELLNELGGYRLKSKLVLYILLNSQGHMGTGPRIVTSGNRTDTDVSAYD